MGHNNSGHITAVRRQFHERFGSYKPPVHTSRIRCALKFTQCSEDITPDHLSYAVDYLMQQMEAGVFLGRKSETEIRTKRNPPSDTILKRIATKTFEALQNEPFDELEDRKLAVQLEMRRMDELHNSRVIDMQVVAEVAADNQPMFLHQKLNEAKIVKILCNMWCNDPVSILKKYRRRRGYERKRDDRRRRHALARAGELHNSHQPVVVTVTP